MRERLFEHPLQQLARRSPCGDMHALHAGQPMRPSSCGATSRTVRDARGVVRHLLLCMCGGDIHSFKAAEQHPFAQEARGLRGHSFR
mmetsp:Transcript_87955/g.221924  ORF Transcript_87955/g.221924 Transcript_87955/m.221924 type:complete len:87 (-) Transcript_87955:140-400(-)